MGDLGQRKTEGEGLVKINTELGVSLPQTKDHVGPTEAGGGKETVSPEPCNTPVSDLGFHGRETKHFCCFKPRSFWHFVTAAQEN